MSMFTARKVVAIFTAASLAFLQAVPAGLALPAAPRDQLTETSVPTTTLAEAQATTPAQPAQIPSGSLTDPSALSLATPDPTPSSSPSPTPSPSASPSPKPSASPSPKPSASPSPAPTQISLTSVKPALQKFYGNEPVPTHIRITPNPPANMIEVIVSELRGTALVDVTKITIMTYGGQYNISKVEDLQNGIVSQFMYKTGYVLYAIWRTKGGYWTSQINNIVANTADIVPIAPPVFGDATPVKFTSHADLLKQAAAMEIPTAAQNTIRQAKTAAGDLSFHFSYTLSDYKGYKVVITNPSAVVGGLSRMEFVVKRDGTIDAVTLQVTYRGAVGDLKPDSQLLFAGMKLLQPGASDVAALVLMGQIKVLEIKADNSIVIEYQNHPYDISKTTSGQVYLLPNLELPSVATVSSSTLKHYDASGVLLRETVTDAAGKIVSVTVSDPSRILEIPAKVESYLGNGDHSATISFNDSGQWTHVDYLTGQTNPVFVGESRFVQLSSEQLARMTQVPSNQNFYYAITLLNSGMNMTWLLSIFQNTPDGFIQKDFKLLSQSFFPQMSWLDVSSDGRMLIYQDDEGSISMLRWEDPNQFNSLGNNRGQIQTVAFQPDQIILTTSTQTIYINPQDLRDSRIPPNAIQTPTNRDWYYTFGTNGNSTWATLYHQTGDQVVMTGTSLGWGALDQYTNFFVDVSVEGDLAVFGGTRTGVGDFMLVTRLPDTTQKIRLENRGRLRSAEFKNSEVVLITASGDRIRIDKTTLQEILIPEGAVQTKSNPNFYYLYHQDGSMSLYKLNNNQVTVKTLPNATPNASDVILDVSPDGSTVVWGASAGDKNYIWTALFSDLVVKNFIGGRGELQSFTFSTAEIVLHTTQETIYLSLPSFRETFPLSEGAVQTSSNPDYYYQVSGSSLVLFQRNGTRFFRSEAALPEAVSIRGLLVDVSSDGQTLVYGTRPRNVVAGSYIRVSKLGDRNQIIQTLEFGPDRGMLKSVQFTGNEVLLTTTQKNIQVDRSVLKEILTKYVYGSPLLSVTLYADLSAQITWDSDNFTGQFDPVTKEIKITLPAGTGTKTWRIQFEENAGGLAKDYWLKTAETAVRDSSGKETSFTHYLFSQEGLMLFRETRSSFMGISSAEKWIFAYDPDHQLKTTVKAALTNGYVTVTYQFADKEHDRSIQGNLYPQDQVLFDSLNDPKQIPVIENLLTTVIATYIASDGHTASFMVDFTRDAQGQFTVARRVVKNGLTYIVHGQADVLSSETDDELFVDYQEANGYMVTYGEILGDPSATPPIQSTFNLLFYKPVKEKGSVVGGQLPGSGADQPFVDATVSAQTDKGLDPLIPGGGTKKDVGSTITISGGTWEFVAAVDYPNQKVVVLEGSVYLIKLDTKGKVILTAFVAALQTDLGTGFRVTAIPQDDGTFLIQVVDSALYVSVGTAVSVKIASVAGGSIRLTAAPQTGVTKYRIEHTTNFSTWSPLATVAATAEGGLDYVDHPSGAVGFYRVTVAEAIQPPQGALKQMTFVLGEEGLLKGGSVTANYYQINNANGNLLFEGMKLLGSGASDVSVLGSMSRVQVTKVESAGSIYLLYQNKYYKIYAEAGQVKKMQMANLQGVYLPYDALFTGLRQEYPLTQITAAQFQESLEATVQYSDLVAQAYAFMTDPVNHILPAGTSFPVLFLKGINLSPEALKQFAMAAEVYDIVVVPLEPFLALPQDSMTRRNWIVRMTSHEATHLVDITENPNIAFLTSEAHAFAVTAKVARILGFSPEQIAKQEKVAVAFNILSNNPQVVTQIFNTGIQNFRFVGYESIQLPGGSVVRIGLHLDSQIRMVDVDVSAPAGSQISVIQNDASGRLNLRTQYGTGAVLWTQQYYYTGASTTPDYSKRTYANGDIDYYNAAGQLFIDVLLNRQNFTRELYTSIQNSLRPVQPGSYFVTTSYETFVAAGITSEARTAFKKLIALGMQADSVSFLAYLRSPYHVVLRQLQEHPVYQAASPGWIYSGMGVVFGTTSTTEKVLIFYCDLAALNNASSAISAESARLALPILAHEMKHSIDTADDAAHMEWRAYQAQLGWMRLLNFNRHDINRQQWLVDRIPDNSFNGSAAKLATGAYSRTINPRTGAFYTYAEALAEVMQPLESAEQFLMARMSLPANSFEYVSSIASPRDRSGTNVQGYDIVFKRGGDSYTIFSDVSGEWIYYNNQWSPNAERIATRLLDRTSISSAQYQAMVNWDSSVTGGFVRLPANYSSFINAGYTQQQLTDLQTFITRTFELDPVDFFDKMSRVQHIIISSYSDHGSGHFYPSSGSIIINANTYGSYPSGNGWFFLTTTIFHEATHLKDFSGNASQDFKISEAHAYAENAHWEELFHRRFEYPWNSYNYFKFLEEHIPDNGYDNVVARAVTSETQLATQAMAPLNAAQQFLEPSLDGSVDLKYISSPSATLKKSGTDISGYTFTFQKSGLSPVSAFVDLSGQWIFYGGIWYQLQGTAWIPRG